MNIAVIKDGQVVNVCLFQSLAGAQQFLALGVWPGAQAVVELAEGYGIGDGYDPDTGEWTKAEAPEEPVEPVPTVEDRLAAAEEQNRVLKAQVSAQSETLAFMEDCLVEMAQTVYA